MRSGMSTSFPDFLSLPGRLSPLQLKVAIGNELISRYTELLHTHFGHSVLDSLPEWLQNMDDSYGDGLSMSELYQMFCRHTLAVLDPLCHTIQC